MRIPHYMTRSASGLYSFRMRVPTDVAGCVGLRLIKRTLHTTHLASARLLALQWAAAYARAFAEIRSGGAMAGKLDELLASIAANGTFQYEVDLPSGFRLRADGPDDHQRAMQALKAIGYLADPVSAPPQRAQQADMPAGIERMAAGKARDAWLASIRASTLPKTLTIKKTAVEHFVRFVGEKRELHTITRPDCARWFQQLRDEGASTPTLTNKQSYIGGKRGFMAWAMTSGYYPGEHNPAAGHVVYSMREKRQRRKLGFKAFDLSQVQTLFAPVNFERLSMSARWAAVIGLYTGARASEVGQLLLRDIGEDGGIHFFRITDEGEHQRLKSEASVRTVPIHPDLIALGLLDHVQGLRDDSAPRFFPKGKADAKNGAGNWISKAFSFYLGNISSNWPPAKRGFHSLRKTVIQQLQGSGVVSELRAQLVGHELDDEHHATYSRDFTLTEKLNGPGDEKCPGIAVLSYGLDLEALRKALTTEG